MATLALAVPALLVGLIAGFPFFAALGTLLLAALATAFVVAGRRPGMAVTRSVHPERVQRGVPALARLEVHNPTETRQAGCLATDRVGSRSRTVRVRPLAADGKATYHYELPTQERGRLTVGPLLLHRSDPFGLVRGHNSTGVTVTLVVHPRQLAAKAPQGGHRRHHHEGTTDEALRGSLDLKEVREYVRGDEIRHLHWKATARTGTLMVRELIDPEQPRVSLLLDNRPGALTAAQFEDAVDCAASILSVAARAGQQCRLVTSSGLDVPAAAGMHGVRRLLDVLCELGQEGGPEDELVSDGLAAGSSGGCLVVVTSAGSDLRRLALLRREFAAVTVATLGADGQRPTGVDEVRVLAATNAEQLIRMWNGAAP